jgi:hypothetical protein
VDKFSFRVFSRANVIIKNIEKVENIMKKRILLMLSLIFSIALTALAQTKTVTNSDLEKFREKRLAAEKDYRENYAKLGFPSPQELARRIAEDERRLQETSARLEAERTARERADALNAQINLLETQNRYLQNQAQNFPNSERRYFYNYLPGIFYTPSYNFYINRPRYGSSYDRRRRWFQKTNRMPPIKPPKPIRGKW